MNLPALSRTFVVWGGVFVLAVIVSALIVAYLLPGKGMGCSCAHASTTQASTTERGQR